MSQSKRKFTEDEKKQLLANLEIEVAHKTRQFEAWLEDAVSNFRAHQEALISRIPKAVRNLSMAEFAEKYNGDVHAAMLGIQKEKFGNGLAEGNLGETDKLTRKRKWVESQEAAAEGETSGAAASQDSDSSRVVKNAQMSTMTPKKKPGSSTGPGTAQRARLLANANKTPGTNRTMGRIPPMAPSPSPQKTKLPFSTSAFPRPSRSPTKLPALGTKLPPSSTIGQNGLNRNATRPPSLATFNPTLPPKTPLYPGARIPRKDENMLSVNGSPLANPYELGIGWFKDEGDEVDGAGGGKENGKGKGVGVLGENTLKRQNSITIRRDPSFSFPAGAGHSRANSQASLFAPNTASSSNLQSLPPPPYPPARQGSGLNAQPPLSRQSSMLSALVAIPTMDGHLLEFDPLQTDPDMLDALEGITKSAKKQAKADMGRLVQAAVEKWKIR